jgi:hypothetical protein
MRRRYGRVYVAVWGGGGRGAVIVLAEVPNSS